MRIGPPSFAFARRLPRSLVPLLEALRALGLRHLAAALGVSLLLALLNGYFLVAEFARGHRLLLAGPGFLLTGTAIVVAFVIADAYVLHGARPFLAHGTAVFATAVGTSILRWHLTLAIGGDNFLPADLPLAQRHMEMVVVSILIMVQAGFGTAAYLQWRESDASSRRLRANEMTRAKTERHLQQTQLRAMQARVDTELLFGALERVGELAGTAANERADRLLDDLIALLRLLMPGGSTPMDGDSTTVAHELAIAAAWLRVHDGCVGASREIDLAIAADAAELPLPPMVAQRIARAIARREGAVHAPLVIRADCADATLTVGFVCCDGSSGPILDDSELVKLRARFDDAFGSDRASIVTTESSATLTVHLPHRP